MNETNIKHGYSLLVRDARGAIWNPGPGVQISKAEAEFMPPGRLGLNIEVRGAILGLPGAGIFNYGYYVSPRGRTCQVMHSGWQWQSVA